MRGDTQSHKDSPNETILEKLVGKENTSEINIGNIKTRALIDTGSAISTVCEHFVEHIFPKPIVHDLEEIDLQVKVADGRTLPYTGYIESIIKLPFF